MLPAVLTAVLFASSVILGHRAAKLAGSLEANFWRVVIATTLLALWAFTFGGGLGGGGLRLFVLSGAIGVGFGDFAFYTHCPSSALESVPSLGNASWPSSASFSTGSGS